MFRGFLQILNHFQALQLVIIWRHITQQIKLRKPWDQAGEVRFSAGRLGFDDSSDVYKVCWKRLGSHGKGHPFQIWRLAFEYDCLWTLDGWEGTPGEHNHLVNNWSS